MIKEKILLGAGEIFVLGRKNSKSEDLGKVSIRAVGTCTVGSAILLGRTDTSNEIRDRIARGDRNVKNAMGAFRILDNEPHISIVATIAGLRTIPSVTSCVSLRRHEALFGIRNVISRHAEQASLIVRVDDDPFNYAEPSNRNRSLDGAHVAKVTGYWWRNEITELMQYSNGAASIETNGK